MSKTSPTEAWPSVLAQRFAGLQVIAQQGERIDDVQVVPFGEVIAHEISGSVSQLTRSQQTARQNPSELLKMCIAVTGEMAIEQDGSLVTLKPGELGLYDTRRPYRLHMRGQWRHAVMTAPRALLDVADREVAAAMLRPWPTDAGPGLALLNFLLAAPQFGQPDRVAAHRMGEAAASLLSGVLLSDLNAASTMDPDFVRAEIVHYIRTHLHETDLNTDALATRFHLSRRALQRLFAATDLTVHGVIRSERLQAIARTLRQPEQSARSVSEIALRHGVVDKAWLAKAFKQEFGSSPTHYRLETLGPPGRATT